MPNDGKNNLIGIDDYILLSTVTFITFLWCQSNVRSERKSRPPCSTQSKSWCATTTPWNWHAEAEATVFIFTCCAVWSLIFINNSRRRKKKKEEFEVVGYFFFLYYIHYTLSSSCCRGTHSRVWVTCTWHDLSHAGATFLHQVSDSNVSR